MDIPSSFFERLAAVAAAETLPRFRRSGLVDNKLAAGFDPVTEADREAEKAIRAVINEAFPDHGILGEEFGAETIDARHIWVIDPIDGTRSFISGIPLWGTLVGLTSNGRAVAGMMAQPFTGELFWASAGKAWYDRAGVRTALAARRTASLSEATLCTTTPAYFKGEHQAAYDRLEQSVKLVRYGTDCYAYAMLAAGQIDLVVEVGLQSYDIVALIPIVEAAGGVITGWDGGRMEQGGSVIAAATPDLHAAARAILTGQ